MIRRATTILALLTGLNLLNYIDRYVLSAVLPKIQDDLHLSGFIAGSLGTVFLLGYFLTSPFFGSLADRGGRRTWLIALGIVVWSLATAASGLAASAGSLVLARAFVGVGEAAYATIAPTIIDDIAPPERRGKWLAIFYSAIPIGSALGFIIGGKVESVFGWRAAFFFAGGPGIVVALSCLLVVEPPRVVAKEKVSVVAAFKTLVPLFYYRRAVLGYCAGTFAVGGFAFWAPAFLYRRYDMALDKANFMFGALTVVGGAIGTALGGWLGDRWTKAAVAKNGAKTQEDIDNCFVIANLRVCALSAALATPMAIACFLSPSPKIFFACVFICELGMFLSMSPINAVILRSVPMALRAGAMALSIFAIHLLGDLWSPPLTGLMADHMPIQWAMMILPVALGVSGVIWLVPDVSKSAAGTVRLG